MSEKPTPNEIINTLDELAKENVRRLFQAAESGVPVEIHINAVPKVGDLLTDNRVESGKGKDMSVYYGQIIEVVSTQYPNIYTVRTNVSEGKWIKVVVSDLAGKDRAASPAPPLSEMPKITWE